MKKILKFFGILALVVAILFAGLVAFYVIDTVVLQKFTYVVNGDQETCTITGTKYKNTLSIDIPEEIDGYTVTKIASGAFQGHNCWTVFLPETIEYIGEGAFADCKQLGAVHGLEDCTKLKEIQNKTFMHCYELYEIQLPEGIERIGDLAFLSCYADLSSINIPSTVTTIDYGAFAVCMKLTDVKIPASVEYIGERAFEACYNLESINVEAENANYCSVDGVLYSKDMKTLYVYPSKKSGNEYTIPDSVTTISVSAFAYSYYLETLNIPSSVVSIEKDAIIDVERISKLARITYNGTVDMWNAIYKHPEWNANYHPNFTIYCKNGRISKDGTVTYN